MENDHLKAGEDIHVKWTATSGNVSLYEREGKASADAG
jgi:hypothetical protein